MTPEADPIRIFIGSGDASLLERKTLIHSIRRHTRRRLEIWWYNGTSRTIENEAGERRDCVLPAGLTDQVFATEFSLFRYLIPRLCGHEGKAVYLDSDMLLLADIGELYDCPLEGAHFAARPNAYPGIAPERWALSVMVLDCSTCHFDLPAIFALINEGRFTYTEFAQMGRRARQYLPYAIQPLPAVWNAFDVRDPATRLIHYTDLDRQPWKYRYHPYGDVWFENFREACRAGFITEADIGESISRGYVRPDIRMGNRGDDTVASRALAALHSTWLGLRDVKRRAEHVVNATNV